MNKDLKKANEDIPVRINNDGTVDGRHKNTGGARVGAGRKKGKSKVVLITKLDYEINADKALRKLKKIMFNDEDPKLQLDAIKLYMNYRFGRPVETQEINIFKEQPLFTLDVSESNTEDIDFDEILGTDEK